MKNAFYILSLAIAFSFMSCNGNTSSQEDIKLISADEMQSILDLEDVQLVDVRTSTEYNLHKIANAQNIDYASPTFADDILKLDKTKPVILYCKGGGRSAKCAKILKETGFEKIYDLEGGITKWKHIQTKQLEKNPS